MFCISCGTKLPDNARFCSTCGTSVQQPQIPEPNAKIAEQAVDDLMSKLSPEQQEQLYSDIAKAMLAPIEEAIDTLIQHATKGPVSVDDVIEGRKILENYLESYKSTSGRAPATINPVFFVYQDAYTTFDLHNERWKQALENSDLLLGDLTSFINDGLRGLIGHTALVESAAQTRILSYTGISQFLEEVLLTQLLLCLKLAELELTPQGKSMLLQVKGEEFVNTVIVNMQNAYEHYLAEARKNT